MASGPSALEIYSSCNVGRRNGDQKSDAKQCSFPAKLWDHFTIGPLSPGPSHVGNTVVRSSVHRAVGSCLVCAGLLMVSGTAIAVAEPEGPARVTGQSQSGDSQPGLQHSRKPTHHRSEALGESAVKKTETAFRKVISDVTSAFGSGRVPGQQPSAIRDSAHTPVETPVVTSNKDTEEMTSADPIDIGTSDTVDPASDNSGSPVSPIDPPAAAPVVPVADPTPAVVEAVVPVADVVVPAPAPVETAAPVTPPVASAVWPVLPITDVISSVQSMLTSVASTLAPIATDLGSLLGVNGWSPVVNDTRSAYPLAVRGTAVPTFAATSVLSPPPDFARVGATGLSLKSEADMATVGTIGTASETGALTTSVEMPVPPIPAIPTSVKQLQQFFGHAVREVLRSPSLSALAALALPGILGLFVITGLGIRFGYRQAKAMLALPASGLARYAPPQPLRLVRSQSSITISRPALRFVPSEVRALRAVGPPLENAA